MWCKNQLKSLVSFGLLASSCFASTVSALSIDDLKINGFATVGVLATDDSKVSYLGADNEYSFASDTLAAIQLYLPVNEKTSFTMQLVSKGVDDYDVEAEWAFAKIDVNQYISFRAGRLRMPLYMISESLEVGFSYPWVRPPIEAYDQLDFDNFEGLETSFRIPVGNVNFIVQPFLGTNSSKQVVADEEGTLRSHNLRGFNVSLSYDWLAFRLGYVAGKFGVTGLSSINQLLAGAKAAGLEQVADEFRVDEFNGEFFAAGMKLTPGNLFIMAEYTRRKAGGFAYDVDGWYASAAYTFAEKWTPYIVLGHVESKENYSAVESQLAQLPNAGSAGVLKSSFSKFIQNNTKDHDSVTVGLRMDLMDNVALKLEWQEINPKGDTDAFAITDGPGGHRVQLYSAAVDFIF